MNEHQARRIVRERSAGFCELCRAPATDYAHRRSRAQGGPWRPSNACHMCHACHMWTEAEPAAAAAGGWRLVHDNRDPALVPVWLAPAVAWPGWWLLDDQGCYSTADDQPDRPAVLPPWGGRWAA